MPSLKYKENGEWITVAGSTAFNGRYGNVVPQAEDYAEFYPSREEMNEAIAAAGGTGGTDVETHNTDETAHADIRTAISTAQSAAEAAQTTANGKANASHTQAASTITAGTLAGKVVANATATATVATSQVRNIYAGTEDMTAGTTSLTTGTLYFVYE